MVKIKHIYFIGTVPVMPCLNSLWIMGLRIYGKGRTQIPLSSPATIGPLPGIQDRQGLYWYIKYATKTKINLIMGSFTNHYNAISIDRFPSKTKIEKYSWYFNNSLLCKSGISSATKTFLFLLKTQKTSTATVRPRHLKV